MATWTFCPSKMVPVNVPPEQASVMSMNGWNFSAKPSVPFQYSFKVTLYGLQWYTNAGTGLFDRTTNPTFNARAFEDFVRVHGLWKAFVFPHPHLGNIDCRFKTLPMVPPGLAYSDGLIDAFEVELIHHNPSYTAYD